MDKIGRTREVYSFMWNRGKGDIRFENGHFHKMQGVISDSIVSGKVGIEIGSGSGHDTYVMARDNPAVKIVSLDLSDGVYKTKELIRGLNNVWVIKGSIMALPVKSGAFDFVYSFGVLHHTPDPQKGLFEITRVLKKERPLFLYLYEDHSENVLKYLVLKAITVLRKITVKIPPKILYILSFIASPFVFLIFSCPAIMLRKFKNTRRFAENMPFNFGRSPFHLQADIYDRFAAPIEYRFSKREIYDLLDRCNFYNINITKLKATAGWVAWAYKRPDSQ